MSTNLYFRQIPKDNECIGYQIKFHLSQKLWGHDGSLNGDWVKVDSKLIPYLEGLQSAGNKELSGEAKELISLITKYGEIELSLE